MATVQPGELRYPVTISNIRRSRDENDHYVANSELIQARMGIMQGSTARSNGQNQIEGGAARAVDTITFICRWEVRERISRDATLSYRGTKYEVDWMDSAPWAGRFARIRAVSADASRK